MVTGCANTGNITVIDQVGRSIVVGGITARGTVYNSSNTGDITCTGISGSIRAAGITAIDGTASYSYNTGNVSAISYAQYGSTYAGGISGANYYKKNYEPITNSYNTGTIIAAANSGAYAGGIAAKLNIERNLGASDCFNAGRVTAATTGKRISGGRIHASGIMFKEGPGTINNCYNVGEVTTVSTGQTITNSSTITNCYYLNDQFDLNSITLSGQGKSKDEMMLQSTFKGFDFDAHWEMPEEGYPLLKGLPYTKLQGFELCDSEINMMLGEIVIINKLFLNDDASNKSVYLKSLDPNVAGIDYLGRIVGRMSGTTTIKAVTVDGGFAGEPKVEVVPAPALESISLNWFSVEMVKGYTAQLEVIYAPPDTLDNKEVIWSSSNPGVATVTQDGLVTGVGRGDAVITAKVGDLTATSKIKIIVLMESISLSAYQLFMDRGEKASLSVRFHPEDTTDSRYAVWKSSNTMVATVSSSGLVTAVAAGEAKITVKVGSFSSTCTVKVKVPLYSIVLNKSSIVLDVGESERLTIKYNPPDPTSKPKLHWYSSDRTVASVDYNGVVKAVGPVTAVISARGEGYEATCTVHVPAPLQSIALDKSTLTMYIGQNEKLSIILTPAKATDAPNFTWSSSNNNIVTVSKDGVISAKGNGTATITVRGGTFLPAAQ